MKKQIKGIAAVVLALALVIVIGMKLNDANLKATDGEENIVEDSENIDETLEGLEGLEGESEDAETEESDEESEDAEDEEAPEIVLGGDETTGELIDNTDKYEGTVTISSNVQDYDSLKEGDQITMTASVTGYDGVDYSFQWQQSTDETNWESISGANSDKYTFTLNEETSVLYWRVILIEE